MRKKLAIVTATLALVGVIIYLLWPSTVPDPVYNGRHLSQWMRSSGVVSTGIYGFEPRVVFYTTPPTDVAGVFSAMSNSIRVDTKALPMLIGILRSREGAGYTAYLKVWNRSPNWLRSILPQPEVLQARQTVAATLVGDLGPDGRPATPALIELLQSATNRRSATVNSSGQIQFQDGDLSLDYRNAAAFALGKLGDGSPAVLQALNELSSSNNSSDVDRTAALIALKKLANQPAASKPQRAK